MPLVRAVTALEPSDRAAGALAAGRALGMIGRFEEAATVLELALPPQRSRSEVELLVDVEFIANAWLLADRLPVALERMKHYREADAPAGIGRELMMVHQVALELRRATPSAVAWTLLDKILASRAALREESLVLPWVLMPLVFTDRLDEVEGICAELMRFGEQRGSAYLVAHLAFPRAFAALRLGHLREAEEYGRWSLEHKLARGKTDGRPWHAAPLIDALVEQGDLQAAEEALASLDAPESPPQQLAWATLFETRGRLRHAQARPEEALADLLEAGRRFERLQCNHPGFTVWRCDAARAVALLGDQAEAKRLATEHLDLARTTELPRPIGMAALGLATVSPPREALPMLQEAVESLEGTPAKSGPRKDPRRVRSSPAPCGEADGCAEPPPPRPRTRAPRGRPTAGNARQGGARGGRWASTQARLHRDRRPDGERTPGRPDGSDRGDEPRHRSAAVRNPEDH